MSISLRYSNLKRVSSLLNFEIYFRKLPLREISSQRDYSIKQNDQFLKHPSYRMQNANFQKFNLFSINKQDQVKNRNLFMIQNRFKSTAAIDEAVKSSVRSIKESGKSEIDLSDFQIPHLPSPEEIQLLKATISIHDIGLIPWLPTGLLYQFFDYINKLGVDWPTVIILSTILVRFTLTPLMIKAKKAGSELSNYMAKITDFQKELERVHMTGNLMELNKVASKYQPYMESEETKKFMQQSRFKPFIMPAVQIMVFFTFFRTLSKMANYPIDSLYQTSFLWLPSLAERDPYFILPILTSITLHFILKIGVESGTIGLRTTKIQEIAKYGFPVASMIFTFNFPSAVCIYWCTSNFVSLLTTYFLSLEKVRIYYNIPETVNQKVQKKNKGLSSILKFKDTVTGVKHYFKDNSKKSKIKSMDKIDSENFDKAGSGPLKKTYKYDPTKLKF